MGIWEFGRVAVAVGSALFPADGVLFWMSICLGPYFTPSGLAFPPLLFSSGPASSAATRTTFAGVFLPQTRQNYKTKLQERKKERKDKGKMER